MNDHMKIRRALGPMHASEDTLEEVFAMIEREDMRGYARHTGRRALRTAIIAAALALALAGTAWAVGEYTGFFQTVFGNESIGSRDPENKTLTDEDGNVVIEYVVPGQERAPVDPDQAQELVGDATANVGASVTIEGVTFTVEDFVMDCNGMGVLTYTMEDPEGFPGVEFDGSSMLSDPLAGGTLMTPVLTVHDGGGKKLAWLDSTQYVAAGGTDTKKTVVLYFAAFDSLDGAEQLKLTFSVATGYDAAKGELDTKEGGILFPMAGAVDAETLTGPEGWSAGLSPVGLKLMSPEGKRSGYDYYFKDVALRMADGTEYVLEQEESYMYNITVGAVCDDGGTAMVFDRLVDPAQVQSVTAVARDARTDTDFTLTFTK